MHAKQAQGELFAYWRHHAFITNRTEPMHLLDSEHRQHVVVKLVIRDLKRHALAHFPYRAWTVIACLAHNLSRWTACSACLARHQERRAPRGGDCSGYPEGLALPHGAPR